MSYKAKYKREVLQELITRSRVWNAQGANSYMLYNQGNTNATINGNFILEPKMIWSSPDENPEVQDWSDINIQFDQLNTPSMKAPEAGSEPSGSGFTPGIDPPPAKDNRIVIFKSFIIPA